MTAHLLDISRWQVSTLEGGSAAASVDLSKAKAAGFTLVNIALTGSRGAVSGDWVRTYTDRARALGMGVMTYHWLDNRTTGAAQAAVSLRRMAELGVTAHQVDVEDTTTARPTYAHVRDYVTAMQDALGHHIMIYTADWWWPPDWDGAALSPYLMAAPNAGRIHPYPGDTSPHWVAGYGGWTHLSAMQYAVAPIGGVDCSLTGIRELPVWSELAGELQMTQSTEYPDLRWIPPKRAYWSAGRPNGPVKFIVIHHTAGGENPDSAEAGALYNQTRPDSVSAHYYVDSSVEFTDAVVHQVLTKDRAATARFHGNQIGIQYELCGTLQTRAQWLDSRSRRIIRHAAKQIARDMKKYDLPLRWMTRAQTRAAYYGDDPGGITTHNNCTFAFPEDNGTHTDPGPHFPDDILMADIAEFMAGDDDMFDDTDKALLIDVADRMNAFTRGLPTSEKLKLDIDPPKWEAEAAKFRTEMRAATAAQKLRDEAVLAAVADDADKDEILARVDAKAAELGEQVAGVDEEVVAKLDGLDGADLIEVLGGPETAMRLRDALNAALGQG